MWDSLFFVCGLYFFFFLDNHWVRSKINSLVGPQRTSSGYCQKTEIWWFGYVTHHDSLSKTILQGTLESGWHCGRQRKCWMDNIKEWTSLPVPELLTMASCRKGWKRISTKSSLISPQWPSRSRDWTELNLFLEGRWHNGWQRKYWMYIKEWTPPSMPELMAPPQRRLKKRISAISSFMHSHPHSLPPPRLPDWLRGWTTKLLFCTSCCSKALVWAPVSSSTSEFLDTWWTYSSSLWQGKGICCIRTPVVL